MFDCILRRNERRREKRKKERSDEIDKLIREDKVNFRFGYWGSPWRILVLGTEGSGKSTIFKQMQLIHHGGFSEDERKACRGVIYRHVIQSVEDVLAVTRELGLAYAHEESLINLISEHSQKDHPEDLSPEMVNEINQFWCDPMVKSVVEQHGSWGDHFEDNGQHFLSRITRIGSPEYIPTEEDILLARTPKTMSVLETRFSMEERSIYLFTPPPCTRTLQRKRWIDFYGGTTSIIFCVSLTDYDKVFGEAKSQNRLTDSLLHWESIFNSHGFHPFCIILFLNKLDAFKRKLPKVPLEDYFPDYTGGNDVAKAANYIIDKFKQANQSRVAVYPHLTELTDTKNTRLMFRAVNETIQQNLVITPCCCF